MKRSLGILASLIVALSLGCTGGNAPETRGGPVAMRRLTPAQYEHAIADTFGPDIEVTGRFEPDNRKDGLVAVGTSIVTVSPVGFEQYEAIAGNVARQVVGEERRETLIPCTPESPTAADAGCTAEFLRAYAPRLLRRPVSDAEIQLRVDVAGATADASNDFYGGLELALTSLLVAPDFLFRVDVAEPDPTSPERLRLTDVTLASRLSYLSWNSGPDEELLAAAQRGDLSDPTLLAAQVDRLLASQRFEDGTRAFFEDLYRFDEFRDVGKDPVRYPVYTRQLALDAREQTLRVVVNHLVNERGDYRDLFTTRRSFITRTLGPLYGVPVRSREGWESIEFPEGHPRAGLLTHASFNMLHAHPGRSSPTLRGVFLREALLCQSVPPAPADVEFALFNDDDNPEYKTARDRLAAHASSPTCRNCHKLSDPIGLGLEVFDGVGKYRTTENQAPIDTSGDLDGSSFANHVQLGQAFAQSPLIGPCLVDNLYRYGVGREPILGERAMLRALAKSFAASGYRLHDLMREIALSEGFRTASEPRKARKGPATHAEAGQAKEGAA
ncbi:MAG: DUF1592 domain-containing protein [Candidatus Binatia bacterium]|nr:DUF1592 domain-containing protein [Candidatus Binatia bacterium]